MRDITTREDIELLMKTFYEKLLLDETISYIFTEVAKINIEKHIPVITDFWESILLHKNVYHNNTMKIHMDLNAKSPLLKKHFDIWLKYFTTTIDQLFEGEIAVVAKQRALSIATVMQIKIVERRNTK